MAQDPYKYFRLEARELLDHLGKGILELDKGAGVDVVQRILRHAHTLKGAARVVRQREIADRAHAIEDALAPHRERAEIPPATVAKLLGLLDEIAGLSARLGDGGASVPSSKADDARRSVRTELADMDALLNGVMETHTRLGAVRGTARLIDDARQLAEVLVDNLASPNLRDIGGRTAPRARAMAEQLRDLVRTAGRELGTATDQLHRELVQVRDRAEQLRLVAAETLFISLERTIHDGARALGKQVELEPKGGDVRLDAHVLGAIHGALVQLARNAVAHGIESPQERVAAGKPPTGRVSIEVVRRGRRVLFVCRDDGRGVDLEAVRAAAKRAGLVLTETGMIGGEDVLRLLLRGGLSTTSTITEAAGRGIGLDVVREVTERLGGTVSVRTSSSGTTFELEVPASLASLEGLTIEMAGIHAIVPLDCVRRTARLAERDVSRAARSASIIHDGIVIPLVPLAEALRASRGRRRVRATWSAVIVEGSSGLAAVAVDRLLGVSTVVVRPLPELAVVDPIVAGAALDADGNPMLVLDPDGLVAEARRERSADDAHEAVRHAVLVIDDSLTTRMLEQSILESAGFDVDTAISGEQALEVARRKRYSLFLVDVEMPGIDGYTFIERIRSDSTLRDTPAILVTSRSSAADRRRGEDVGAQGFIVKSEFDQGELVARIQKLVG